jgi:translation initiation factor IF-3
VTRQILLENWLELQEEQTSSKIHRTRRLQARFLSPRRTLPIAYFNNPSHPRPEKRYDPINEHIHYPEVLVIGPNGEQLGKMPSRQANELAASYNLDLYCVAPNANPPVCKILNYGKYRFEQQKQERISKRNQHVAETKQIQLHPNIGIHDLETKAHHAHDFLEEGDKVQVSVVFKGREMAHQEIGEDLMKKFMDLMSDVATVEKAPYWEGKWYNAVLAAKAKK